MWGWTAGSTTDARLESTVPNGITTPSAATLRPSRVADADPDAIQGRVVVAGYDGERWGRGQDSVLAAGDAAAAAVG